MTKDHVKATFNVPSLNGGSKQDQVTVYIPKREILGYIERTTGISVILSPNLNQRLLELKYTMVRCEVTKDDL